MTELYEKMSGSTDDSLACCSNRTAAGASPSLSHAAMAVLNDTYGRVRDGPGEGDTVFDPRICRQETRHGTPTYLYILCEALYCVLRRR